MKIPKEAVFSILERLGLEPEDKDSYFLVRCPSCGRKEMYLYKKGSRMVCNRQNKCGVSYSLFEYIKETGIIKTDEVRKEAALALFNDTEEKDEIEQKSIEIPEGIKYFKDTKSGIFRDAAYSYLINRGIPERNIHSLGYIYEPSSPFNKTIFFPFYEGGDIVFFVCRDYTGTRYKIDEDTGEKQQIRYLNPKGASASNFIFNSDRIKEGSDVFIFEGIMDALTLDSQIGTAMIKAYISPVQASKIWNKMPGRVILVPDTDAAGQKALPKNIATLGRYKPPSLKSEILVYDIPKPFKDLNQAGINKIDINECKPYSKMRALELFDWKIKAPL